MEEWIETFLAALAAEKQCSPHTVVAYRNDLLQLVAHLKQGGTESWREVTSLHVNDYLNHLHERQYASSTIARKTAAMKSFFLHLRIAGEMSADLSPFLAAPRVDRYVPHAISSDEMTRLLAAPTRVKTPEALRDAAMLELLYATGVRVSELVALDLTDLEPGRPVVRCHGRADRERTLPLSNAATDAMTRYLLQGRPVLARSGSANHEALFLNHRGQRLTRQGFWLILKGYAESVAVRNVTPHTLRHTFAAHALKTGRHLREIQTTLGHVSISTTQVYQRTRPVAAAVVLGGTGATGTTGGKIAPAVPPAPESRPLRPAPLASRPLVGGAVTAITGNDSADAGSLKP